MIENKIIKDLIKKKLAEEYIYNLFKDYGYSSCKITKTPVGYKVIVYALKPQLIIKNFNLKQIEKELAKKFKLENPFLEIRNIETHPDLDPVLVAQRVLKALEVQGVGAYKRIGYKYLTRIIKAGAHGAEIRINGKVPGDRGASWRFYAGYLPKVGEIVQKQIKYANVTKTFKPGIISVDVFIFPSEARLPEEVIIKELAEKEEKNNEK
ncbi:MAG TPA: 30S ribosomal protein S3 [Nautiliaceae bacterium]|nr:30S ribosomal protein S3 [Nautiliaceae bacterium]